MATSANQPSPSSSSSSLSSEKEHSNHTRLCRLLVDIGRQVLQDVFDRINPPATLPEVLFSRHVYDKLTHLLAEGFLHRTQWNTLFPDSGGANTNAKSADFDITLLFMLLRNICDLSPPETGWNKAPEASDFSMEADIIRVKICRNELCAHIVDERIPDTQFEALWNDTKAALLRLGGPRYEEQIQRLLHEAIDPESEQCFKVLLLSWEEEDEWMANAVRHVDKKRKYIQK